MAVKKASKANNQQSVQDVFFQRLKELLPPKIGLAEELADILNVSIDSAYRRIRGETEISLNEIFKISKHYNFSVDEIFGNQSSTVTFKYTKLTDNAKNFEDYLNRLINHLKTIAQFDNKKIFYVAEEVPIFYSFFTKKLTAFKLFYWQRSVLNVQEYQHQKFDWNLIPENLINLAHNSFKEYLNVPSAEVWTDGTILTGIRQIMYYCESGLIDKNMALELLTDYRAMVEMLNKNAANARKNVSDAVETFFMYQSDIVLGTNCIYIIMGDARYSYISFNTMNSLSTTNAAFCEETDHWVRNLEKKSTLISGVAEKQRYQFFSYMFKCVDDAIQKVKTD
ncbi:MAG: helix-turn-helix transcriptional regulator [Bacteroidota bacterium]